MSNRDLAADVRLTTFVARQDNAAQGQLRHAPGFAQQAHVGRDRLPRAWR